MDNTTLNTIDDAKAILIHFTSLSSVFHSFGECLTFWNLLKIETNEENVKLVILPVMVVNIGRVWIATTCTFKANEFNL